MRSLISVHAGEFLVGDHITRKLGGKYDVWVPAKDGGVDLLVTRRGRRARPVGLQVKSSREFRIPKVVRDSVSATSWFKLDTRKIRESRADLWVFVIGTIAGDEHFVVIPTRLLRRRIPRGAHGVWHVYLWVCKGGSCFETRNLRRIQQKRLVEGRDRNRRREFTEYMDNWGALDRLTRGAR